MAEMHPVKISHGHNRATVLGGDVLQSTDYIHEK